MKFKRLLVIVLALIVGVLVGRITKTTDAKLSTSPLMTDLGNIYNEGTETLTINGYLYRLNTDSVGEIRKIMRGGGGKYKVVDPDEGWDIENKEYIDLEDDPKLYNLVNKELAEISKIGRERKRECGFYLLINDITHKGSNGESNKKYKIITIAYSIDYGRDIIYEETYVYRKNQDK